MRKSKRLQEQVDELRLYIEGPDGLRAQLRFSREGERLEFRMRKRVEREAKDLQEALEALIDAQPYLYPNPNSPKADEYEARRQAALDQAAVALEARAGPEGYRVK